MIGWGQNQQVITFIFLVNANNIKQVKGKINQFSIIVFRTDRFG